MSEAETVPADLEQALENATRWELTLALGQVDYLSDYRYVVGCPVCGDVAHPYKIRSELVQAAEAQKVGCPECDIPVEVVDVESI